MMAPCLNRLIGRKPALSRLERHTEHHGPGNPEQDKAYDEALLLSVATHERGLMVTIVMGGFFQSDSAVDERLSKEEMEDRRGKSRRQARDKGSLKDCAER